MIGFSQRRRSAFPVILRWGILVLVFFLVFQIGSVRKVLENALFSFAAPFWRAERTVAALGARVSPLTTKEEAVEENGLLKERNRFLEAKTYMIPLLEKENAELKKMLLRRPDDAVLLLARVLVPLGRSPYDTLVVDIGERDGVKAGALVTAYDTVVLGVIERVYARTSLVKLFSSPKETVEVVIGEERTPATAEGLGGGAWKTRMPKGVTIREGDTVLLPSSASDILGIVASVAIGQSDSFQTIFFQAPVNLYKIEWVYVRAGDVPDDGSGALSAGIGSL